MCSPVCLLPSLIQCMRLVRGSLSATAAAGRVGFGRRGSRTPTVGGRLRHLGRWLRTQCTAVARPRPFACRRSCVISRLCTCCRWVMRHHTSLSPASRPVSVVPADLGERPSSGRLRWPPSLPSHPVSPRLVYRLVYGAVAGSRPGRSLGERATAGLSVVAGTLTAMNVDVWLPPVLAVVIGALALPQCRQGVARPCWSASAADQARPGRRRGVVWQRCSDGRRSVPAAFAAYQAELNELPPPADRDAWQTAQQHAASQPGPGSHYRHPSPCLPQLWRS